MRYRTEISIPADHYVCVQLPAFLPEGRAILTVTFQASSTADDGDADLDLDRQDIEWWDEFETETETDPVPGY